MLRAVAFASGKLSRYKALQGGGHARNVWNVWNGLT